MIRRVDATVLFVQDLEKCTRFYRDTLGFEETFRDEVSMAFRLQDQDFVVLQMAAAAEMVGEEALAAGPVSGSQVLLCADVGDVDATYDALGDRSQITGTFGIYYTYLGHDGFGAVDWR